MDWNAQPLVSAIFIIGGAGFILGMSMGIAAVAVGEGRIHARWMFTIAAASALVLLSAAVIQGFL